MPEALPPGRGLLGRGAGRGGRATRRRSTARSRARASSRPTSRCSARWSRSAGVPGAAAERRRGARRRFVATRRAARDFLRAAVFAWSAPRVDARSIVRTSSRCSAATRSASPSETARLEALRQRLDRRAVAEVLDPLPLLDQDALLLLLDVRHSRKCPLAAGRAMVADPTGRIAARDGLDTDTSEATPDARPQQPPDRALDRGLLARDRDLAGARPRARDGQRLLLRRHRAHQRVHGRDPDPERRPRAPRRRRALGCVRPGVQRPAREGRATARLARRVDALLADAPRPRRRHRGLHPARAAAHAPVRGSRRRLRARGRSLARPLPDRRPARPVRDRRRDPQHVPPLRAAGARARRLERRDRRRAPPRRSADRRRERAALPLRGGRRARHARAAPPADPVAAPARRPADDGHRLARPGGQARARPDAAGHADDRPRERELPRRHAVRVAAARPGARARRDRQGVPALHAPAGHLRGRRHDGALPDARPVRRAQRHRRAAARARRWPAPDRLPPRAGRPALDRRSPSRSCASSTSAASSPPTTR